MPVLYRAFSVYSDRGGVTRSALEARLLADEPPEAIARKCATEAAVVRAYEILYYDVRGRLKSPDYIFNQAIGPRLRDGTAAWNYDLVWKVFGYLGGALVLDELMDTCRSGLRPANAREVVAYLSEDARRAVRLQMAVAARVVWAGDRAMAAALVRAYAQKRSGEGEEEMTSDALLLRGIDAMLREIQWGAGADAGTKLPAPLAVQDQAPAELRDNEVQLLATGQEVPGLADLKKMKLPPPRTQADKCGQGPGQGLLADK